MDDLIDRLTALELVHNVMYEFFHICDDDEESPLTEKEKLLFAINKRLTKSIKELPSEYFATWNNHGISRDQISLFDSSWSNCWDAG